MRQLRAILTPILTGGCVCVVCFGFWAGQLGCSAAADLESVPPGQIGLSSGKLDAVTRYLQSEVASGRIAGAVGLVARHGKVGYFEAVGMADREAGTAMETTTLFRIASMTKAITSAAVLTLVEEGAIRLDDPVSKYLPEFSEPAVLTEGGKPVPATRVPSIHDLLTHTSGIGYGWFGPEAQDAAYRDANIPDILVPVDETIAERVARIGDLPLAFQPGSQWAYGLSIDVLGRVLEVVAGLTVEQFFHERLFRPLGMGDTHFYLPERKRPRLAALYTPHGSQKNSLRPVGATVLEAGPIKFSSDFCLQGKGKLFAGGSGLVSSTLDYARFLQMFLDAGRPLLRAETVAEMTANQIAALTIPFPGHGDGFGYGFGVLTERGKSEDVASVGTYSWGGIFNTYYWVDPQTEMIGILMMQVFPNDHLKTRAEFKRLAYEAIDDSGFSRIYHYEKGVEHGNPFFNSRQLRVNAAAVSTHETFSQRSEPRSSGMARILVEEDLRRIRRADLSCEVWGGHPGTANKRVTINGRRTHPFPEVGTASRHCTHQYPSFNLSPNELVNGYNSLQFACDAGTAFWGHYIVDNACLKIGLDAEDTGMRHFTAKVRATRDADSDAIDLQLAVEDHSKIARVDYQAHYHGYDENGNGRAADWHGMTRGREPYGMLGSATEAPFQLRWETAMLPAQTAMAVRAIVHFKDPPNLVYETPAFGRIAIAPRASHRVTMHHVEKLPTPFWSRNDRRLECTIVLPMEPSVMEAAELHVVTWTGGAGGVKDYFTLNGHPLKAAQGNDHAVEYSRLPIDPAHLRKGANRIVLHSASEHHGIEVLLPGPALVIRAMRPGVGAVDSPLRLPAGFTASTVVEGINAATTLAIAPDGRVFYAEQTGVVRVVKDGRLLPRPAIDLAGKLDTWWERGLIGLTFHPDFPRSPYVFLVYVARDPFTRHVVSRFTVVGDSLDPKSERVLLEGDDQSKLGGSVPAGHQGGPICFGSDGMLYIGLGEQTAGKPAQALDTLQGKILRIRPDGAIPEDNPFLDQTEGKYRAIYAIGIRNPFGLAVEPNSGRLLETDVGASAFEEINVIEAGGNYGWPEAEGMSGNEKFVDPVHAYPPVIGRSICGALFYPQTGNFPEAWKGKFFFVDWANHWIKAIDIDQPERLIPFGEGLAAPVGMAAAPDGSVYVLNRNTRWRDGKKFQKNAGSLVQIRYVGESEAPPQRPVHAPTLEATGVFASVADCEPATGFHAFALNAPLWRPGVTARRWIRVPTGGKISVSREEPWQFPRGSTIAEHFDTTRTGQRHETHVYTANGDGTFQAGAYRWSARGDTAELVENSAITRLAGEASLQWFSPGAERALHPELALVGFVPRFTSAGQLNVGSQLTEWRDRAWLDSDVTDAALSTLPRLAGLDEQSATLAHRVRSHLDSHCAACHRPGGPSRGFFDARFSTPFDQQRMRHGELMAGDLGIEGARVLVPGSPEQSILYQRMRRHDAFRMPPVVVNTVPSPALPLVERWIRSMPMSKPKPSSKTKATGSVRLTEEAIDASAGDLPAYKIETPSATYFLEKSGAGLSSLLDADGNDWLGFHPAAGSGAGGEYRGFPNAVHRQAGNYFHARNTGTDPSTTRVTRRDPDRVSITAEGENGKWACRYDFTASHCTFTMTRMAPGKKYWVLYEGTPGNEYDDTDWWMTSAVREKQPLSKNHEGDIPAPEWIAFGEAGLKRALVLYHHQDDAYPDRFYQMEKKMTVFGFGRSGLEKYLDAVPQSVSIGLVEDDDPAAIGEAIRDFEGGTPAGR